MIPEWLEVKAMIKGIPRMSGDDPGTNGTSVTVKRYSPHERG